MTSNNDQARNGNENRENAAAAEILNDDAEEKRNQSRNVSSKTELKK
jgi:hypothetical protein